MLSCQSQYNHICQHRPRSYVNVADNNIYIYIYIFLICFPLPMLNHILHGWPTTANRTYLSSFGHSADLAPHTIITVLATELLGSAHSSHAQTHLGMLVIISSYPWSSATAMFSLARPQQRPNSLSHSNILTHSATATFSFTFTTESSDHPCSHSGNKQTSSEPYSVSCSVQALCRDYLQDIFIHLALATWSYISLAHSSQQLASCSCSMSKCYSGDLHLLTGGGGVL